MNLDPKVDLNSNLIDHKKLATMRKTALKAIADYKDPLIKDDFVAPIVQQVVKKRIVKPRNKKLINIRGIQSSVKAGNLGGKLVDNNKILPNKIDKLILQTPPQIIQKNDLVKINSTEKKVVPAIDSKLIAEKQLKSQIKKIAPKIKINPIRWLTFFALIFICLSFILTVFFVPKIDNSFIKTINQFVTVPAIIIDGQFISYDDYKSEIRSVKLYLDKEKNHGIITEIPSNNEIKKSVQDYLIRREILHILAKENNLVLTKQDFDAEIKKITERSRSVESFAKTLDSFYGWTIDDFKNKVIEPYLIGIKLQQKLFPNITDTNELKRLWENKIKETENKVKVYVLIR